MKHILFFITALLTIQSFAVAQGIETGNSSFLTGLKITLSGKHPEHETIMSLINSKAFPVRLREALIQDLLNTSIIFSSEKFTYKDLENRMTKYLVDKYTTIKTINGMKVETTTEFYEYIKELNKYGIYPEGVENLKVSNMKDMPLLAFTNIKPKQVVYFSKMIQNLSQKQKMELVFHEQVHRLYNVFGKRAYDERFASAWASAIVNYLTGDMNKEEFYLLLGQNNIATHTTEDDTKLCDTVIDCFPDNISTSKKNEFISSITVGVKGIDIIDVNANERGIVLFIDSKVYKDYPPLFNMGIVEVKFRSRGESSRTKILKMIKEMRQSDKLFYINHNILYTKRTRVINREINRSYSISDIQIPWVKNAPRIMQNIKTHARGFSVFENKPYEYFFKIYKQENQVLERDYQKIVKTLNDFKQNYSHTYQKLFPAYNISIKLCSNNSVLVSRNRSYERVNIKICLNGSKEFINLEKVLTSKLLKYGLYLYNSLVRLSGLTDEITHFLFKTAEGANTLEVFRIVGEELLNRSFEIGRDYNKALEISFKMTNEKYENNFLYKAYPLRESTYFKVEVGISKEFFNSPKIVEQFIRKNVFNIRNTDFDLVVKKKIFFEDYERFIIDTTYRLKNMDIIDFTTLEAVDSKEFSPHQNDGVEFLLLKDVLIEVEEKLREI